MSAIGTKRTWPSALHVSAFGGGADVACGVPSARLYLTLTTVAKSLSMMTSGDDGVTEKIHFILRLLKTQRQRIA